MASLKRKAGANQAASTDPKKAKQSSLMSFFAAGGGANTNGNTASSSPKAPAACKPSAAAAPAPLKTEAAKFDKAKWVAGLTKEQQQLLKLEIDTLGESWLALLKDDITTTSFLDLKRFLCREHDAGRQIFPPPEDVYSWSRYVPFDDVKVVIVGQDPYHNVGQAHGLAFSVKPPIPPPPSLKNMYIALKKDYPDTFQVPKGGSLTPWAERGVLMLNTCLTVRAHEANSHSNHGWERFTQRIIDLVAQRRPRGVVFMAWGSPAAKRVVKIDSTRHLVLRSVHPSPLSAHRGFFDCKHFRRANEWLMERYGAEGEINWSLVPGGSTIEGLPKVPEVEAPVKAEEKAEDDADDENKTDVEEEEEEEEKTVVPAKAVPSKAVPSTVVPSNGASSNHVPSNAVPSNAAPSKTAVKENKSEKAASGEDEKENVKVPTEVDN